MYGTASRDSALMSQIKSSDIRVCARLAPVAAHGVELVVGPHVDQVGHAVRQRKESGDGADVPDILVGKTAGAQGLEVGFVYGPRLERGLHRKVEHGALLRRDVGLAVVDRYLIGDQR